MSKKHPQFINSELYHISFRAVGDSMIFKDDDDHYRGVFSIYEFNTNKSIEIREQRRQRRIMKASRGGGASGGLTSGSSSVEDSRDLLVEILTFCFMPNHIHLLVRQLQDNGISNFMKKVRGGYASYCNTKYHRKGHLFNRFNAVHIKSNDQLKNVFVYIHVNPISLIEPGWKEKGIKNTPKVIRFLKEKYRWSSFFDYIGKKNFPSVTVRDFLTEVMGGITGCKIAIEDWVKYKGEIKDLENIIVNY